MDIDRNWFCVTVSIENAHAILVLLETNTSSPSVTPTVLKARCKAVVPLVVVIPYLQLTKLLNLFSNSLTYGPCPTKDVSKQSLMKFFSC